MNANNGNSMSTSSQVFERDSTAIASMESHFFVLKREVIMTFKTNYKKEYIEMEQLAMKRRTKHRRILKELTHKVALI